MPGVVKGRLLGTPEFERGEGVLPPDAEVKVPAVFGVRQKITLVLLRVTGLEPRAGSLDNVRQLLSTRGFEYFKRFFKACV